MRDFIEKHRECVIGTLSGWDRIRFRGTQRMLAHVGGLMTYLGQAGVLLKEFGDAVERKSAFMKTSVEQCAAELGCPSRYVNSGAISKEAIALEMAGQNPGKEGLVCLLSAVEPCMSFMVGKDPERKRLVLRAGMRKCLHLYGYMIDETFGWMSIRMQTWFPFTIQVCINGREWLARQMKRAGIEFERRDNCFAWISDMDAAQTLMSAMDELDWPRELERVCRAMNPRLDEQTSEWPVPRYWSAQETEWATDVMFRGSEELTRIYPALVRGSIVVHGAKDIMRFLGGRKLTATFTGEAQSDVKTRIEGIRVKHRVKRNSIKFYDKQGSVLRVETTLNDPSDFKAFRPKEGGGDDEKEWRKVRQGVADLHRRGVVSQAANERLLDALASFDTGKTLEAILKPVCQPVPYKGRNARGLNPGRPDDRHLIQVISQGSFALGGFRNRDLVPFLKRDGEEAAITSRRITNLLRILRAHRIIRKISKTNRYLLTPVGCEISTAILKVYLLTLQQVASVAA